MSSPMLGENDVCRNRENLFGADAAKTVIDDANDICEDTSAVSVASIGRQARSLGSPKRAISRLESGADTRMSPRICCLRIRWYPVV